MKTKSSISSLLAAAALTCAATAQAPSVQNQTPPSGGNAGGFGMVWEDVSPPTLASTSPTSINAQPGGIQNLIVGTAFEGICRSSNQGMSWSNNFLDFYINDFTPSWWVNDVAFRSTAPNEVVAITMSGAYWSDNHGLNWNKCSYPRPEGSFSVECNPAGTAAVAGGQSGNIWIFDWSSRTWTSEAVPGATFVTDVDFAADGWLYTASNSSPAVWTSPDLGATWQKCGANLPGSAGKLECDPEIVGRAHVISGGELYVTNDGPIRGSWNRTGFGLPQNEILSFIHHPTHPQVMFAGTWYDGVYVSQDYGATFRPIGTTGMTHLGVVDLTIHPEDPSWLFAACHSNSAADGGVFRLNIQR
jgi:hypothetical protein